ncbi:MarR family winged helix-turn-helix transcriptional regulator [Microtetraspora fusca]|uniref:MarR family winged helix-turn-helix transcriptional regulator n=1 Tax=Microtetraspora fusca TaxID=1997 RepID=A0ABW6VIZ8_MICFU|nr:MarR family transcriptional regulator [Microtetraspora fusca]
MKVRPLRENLISLLAITAHVSKQIQEQHLAELGLSVRGHAVLTAIAEGAPTQLAIAHKAGLDKSTLIPVLDHLEQQKLIERHPAPDDRRARIVTITDAGRRALTRSCRTVIKVEDDLLADLTPAEQEQFRTLLQRIVEGRMADLTVPGSCL